MNEISIVDQKASLERSGSLQVSPNESVAIIGVAAKPKKAKKKKKKRKTANISSLQEIENSGQKMMADADH